LVSNKELHMAQKFKGKVITAGYDWSIRLSFAGSAVTFPAGSIFTSQVRRDPNADDVLVTLTSANGGVRRIDDTTLEIRILGEDTLNWPNRTAYIDVVRTDIEPYQHLGFQLSVPVRRAITRIAP
jgi:hypothetical protein